MTKINLKDIFDLAKTEVKKLKLHLSEDQLQKLDFNVFKKGGSYANIYAQLTGDPENHEAIQILNKIASPYSADLQKVMYPNFSKFDHRFTWKLYSPLEIYCYNAPHKKTAWIFAFLRDEITEVQFEKHFKC